MAAGGSYTMLIITGKRHQLRPLQLQSPAVGLEGVQCAGHRASGRCAHHSKAISL